jgi:hypothetical protein
MMQSKEAAKEQGWVAYELEGVSLGDKRLDWRLRESAMKLAVRPSGTITQASDDWADTKAMYRLFANEKTKAEKILAPHQERTKERMAGYETVLVIQDSSTLNYSHQPSKQGMGPIGSTNHPCQGLLMHTGLATTTSGLPLGVVSQRFWARPAEPKQLTRAQRRKLPIAEKESQKWLTALRETVALRPVGTQVVTVGDSEADFFELFAVAHDLQTDLLIRVCQEHRISEPEVGRLSAVLGRCPVAGHLKVQLPQRQEEAAREASVAVRFSPVTLNPPAHLTKTHVPLALFAVLVQEVNPPPDVTPLRWLLLTTVPVFTFDDALERIQWYCQRWQIELYHKALKSGCLVEKSQLATAERLLPLLAIFSMIAWRLLWLTFIARHDPHAPCTTVLSEAEWRALYAFIQKSDRLPAQPPTVRQALLWIARLGGFLARRRDGDPGLTVTWRGWRRLHDLAENWLIFHPSPTCG